MASLQNQISNKKDIAKLSLISGSVFSGSVQGIDHKKYHIIAGVNEGTCIVCTVLINSEICRFIKSRPNALDCQVKITQEKNDFLKHDSFVNCYNPEIAKYDVILEKIESSEFSFLGTIHEDDIDNVIETIKLSGALTPLQEKLLFE